MLQYFINLFSENKAQFYNILLTLLIKIKVKDTVNY